MCGDGLRRIRGQSQSGQTGGQGDRQEQEGCDRVGVGDDWSEDALLWVGVADKSCK